MKKHIFLMLDYDDCTSFAEDKYKDINFVTANALLTEKIRAMVRDNSVEKITLVLHSHRNKAMFDRNTGCQYKNGYAFENFNQYFEALKADPEIGPKIDLSDFCMDDLYVNVDKKPGYVWGVLKQGDWKYKHAHVSENNQFAIEVEQELADILLIEDQYWDKDKIVLFWVHAWECYLHRLAKDCIPVYEVFDDRQEILDTIVNFFTDNIKLLPSYATIKTTQYIEIEEQATRCKAFNKDAVNDRIIHNVNQTTAAVDIRNGHKVLFKHLRASRAVESKKLTHLTWELLQDLMLVPDSPGSATKKTDFALWAMNTNSTPAETACAKVFSLQY